MTLSESTDGAVSSGTAVNWGDLVNQKPWFSKRRIRYLSSNPGLFIKKNHLT